MTPPRCSRPATVPVKVAGAPPYDHGVHELSLCASIARIAERIAAGRPVQRVRVDVGQLRQVVPATLAYSWQVVVRGTELDGATLEVTPVAAVVECIACGRRTELSDPVLRCAACGSADTVVVSGDELVVTELVVTVLDVEPGPAGPGGG
jgi:hydrogenase nickel incorporation protein HypA/HybF